MAVTWGDPSVLTRARTGGRSFTAVGLEFDPAGPTGTPGTPVAASDYIPGRSNTLKANMARVKEKLQTNNRFSERINEATIETLEGVNEFILNNTLAKLYWWAGLGGTAALTAVTATTTGPIVTANGISTIPVTGNFIPGMGMTVNTGTMMEPTMVYAYTAGALQVYGLNINAAALTGITVNQPAADKYANSLLPTAALSQLPLLTVHRNIGGEWELEFPSVYVEKLDINMSLTTCAVQAGLYGTRDYNVLNAGTTPAMSTWSPSTSDENTALHPFTAMNALVAVPGDPAGTGTSGVQAAVGVTDVKLGFNNGLHKYQVLSNPAMQAIPGDDAVLTVDYTEVETAHRDVIFRDYIRVSGGCQMDFGYAKNVGTISSPIYKFATFHAPYVKLEDAAFDDKVGGVGTNAVKGSGMVVRGLPQDLLQVFISH